MMDWREKEKMMIQRVKAKSKRNVSKRYKD